MLNYDKIIVVQVLKMNSNDEEPRLKDNEAVLIAQGLA